MRIAASRKARRQRQVESNTGVAKRSRRSPTETRRPASARYSSADKDCAANHRGPRMPMARYSISRCENFRARISPCAASPTAVCARKFRRQKHALCGDKRSPRKTRFKRNPRPCIASTMSTFQRVMSHAGEQRQPQTAVQRHRRTQNLGKIARGDGDFATTPTAPWTFALNSDRGSLRQVAPVAIPSFADSACRNIAIKLLIR